MADAAKAKCATRARRVAFCLLLLVANSVYGRGLLPAAEAISSAHPLATGAGMEILAAGGNAFDAAVAVSAALAVVEPYSSGVGGGGFWLLYQAAEDRYVMVDGRETAPSGASQDMYLDDQGEFVRDRAINGPLAAGIPGLPAGLVHLAVNYGALPLATSLGPAIKLARDGFPVTDRYRLLAGFRASVINTWPGSAAIFLDNGQVPGEGYIIRQADLAATLKALGSQGRAGFYQGAVAAKLVDAVRSAGGIWTLEDLGGYQIKERPALIGEYRGIKVVSAPPPSSGGIVLIQALNILESFELDSMDPHQRIHVIIEAMRRAYRDRARYLGDPDFVAMPVERLIDKAYARKKATSIDTDQATPSESLPLSEPEGTDTTHFSIIDRHGNRVAATLSINLPFGSGFAAAGTGVLLNNEMDDFAARPLTPNAYGLVGLDANAIAPGKRPLSSMTPTFLEDPDRVGILGTPGGSRIISMVLLGTLSFARGDGPEQWVSLPRYHHQYLPDEVQFELGAFSEMEQAALRRRGHTLNELSRAYGNMNAVLWDRATNRVEAASDPRGEGLASVRAVSELKAAANQQ
jgi:gamma-glutamyltranspeptidase/glutathione hydrolase